MIRKANIFGASIAIIFLVISFYIGRSYDPENVYYFGDVRPSIWVIIMLLVFTLISLCLIVYNLIKIKFTITLFLSFFTMPISLVMLFIGAILLFDGSYAETINYWISYGFIMLMVFTVFTLGSFLKEKSKSGFNVKLFDTRSLVVINILGIVFSLLFVGAIILGNEMNLNNKERIYYALLVVGLMSFFYVGLYLVNLIKLKTGKAFSIIGISLTLVFLFIHMALLGKEGFSDAGLMWVFFLLVGLSFSIVFLIINLKRLYN